MGWADRKALVRRVVHDTFAVECTYRETKLSSAVPLMARLHTRSLTGNNAGLGSGYAQVVESGATVTFDKEELDRMGITPRRNALISFPQYELTVVLDARDSDTGPIIERWKLAAT